MRAWVGLLALGWVLLAGAQTPAMPEVAARAYLLVDVTAGQVLAEREADAPVEPASLTKLMTAYVVFDALRVGRLTLQQTLPVSERAWKMPGSRMFIDPKMQVPVEDLLKGMIVQSGNDATVALAEGVGGSVERFVQLMNDQAKVLGLTATHYANPEGLTAPGHTTTARDLARLAQRLMTDFPQQVAYYALKQYRYPGTPAANDRNRNLLLFRDPSVDGLKTGHTDAAGYCLVATAQRSGSVVRADGAPVGTPRRLLSVVLGAASEVARANESQKLLNWGYSAFDALELAPSGQALSQVPVWKGRSASVDVGQPRGVVVSVPAGTRGSVQTELVRQEPLLAPVARGQTVATLRVRQGERVLAQVPLSALQAVDEAGLLGRAWDALRLWIK